MSSTKHLKLHPLTGTTDHDLTGLVAGELLSVNSAGTSVSSTGLGTDGSGSLSATTFYSGSTDLSDLLGNSTTASNGLTEVGGDIQLGGTLTQDTSITNSGFNFTADAFLATGLSGTSVYSGTTSLDAIFVDDVAGGTNINVTGTDAHPIVNLDDNINVTSVSADTIYSGTTDLDSIFVDDVTAGTNINVTGTDAHPIVNLNNNIDVTSISADTIYSGTTDLYDIFSTSAGVTGSGTVNTIPLWDGSTSITDSILSQNAGATEVTVTGDVLITGNVEVLGTATTIHTNDLAVQDKHILLNSGGTHSSAFEGGICIEDGVSDGFDSNWVIDGDGNWSANTEVIAQGFDAESGQIKSGGTSLDAIFVDDVTAGTNMNVTGTDSHPVVNLNANIDVTSISADTIYSGSTDLSDLFEQNLQEVLDVGSEGTVTSEIKIARSDGATGEARLRLLDVLGDNIAIMQSSDGLSGATFQAGVNVDTTMAFIQGASSTQRMVFDGSAMTVLDTAQNKGIVYAANYHASYTDRSIVDKEYIDNTIASGDTTTASNGLTESGSNITLGGTLTGATTINGGGNNFTITNTDVTLFESSDSTTINASQDVVLSGAVNTQIYGTSGINLNDNTTLTGNLDASGDISGSTIHADTFFSMVPYTGSNPTSPGENNVWFHSGATGTITLNYRIGGSTKSVELS